MIIHLFGRNFGFAISRDSSVVTVLYSEIVFAFIWDITVLESRPQAVEYAGAALIIFGSGTATILKARAAREKSKQAQKMEYQGIILGQENHSKIPIS